MSWVIVKNRSSAKEFAVDWDVVRYIVRGYQLATLKLENAKMTKASDSTWYNPLSWQLPDVHSVEVDWEKIIRTTSTNTENTMSLCRATAETNVPFLAINLQWMLDETTRCKQAFSKKLQDAQSLTMREMNQSVASYGNNISWARDVRDWSADGLILGSSVITGGGSAAVLALASGSSIKGYAKYQDTGSVGAAVLQGVGSAALGAFKISGAKVPANTEAFLLVAKGVQDTSVSYVSGDTFGKSVTNGLVKVASSGAASRIMKTGLAAGAFRKIGLPMIATASDGMQFVHKSAGKILEKNISGALKHGVKNGNSSTVASAAVNSVKPITKNSLLSEAAFESKLLLQLGIINMEKGVGNGW